MQGRETKESQGLTEVGEFDRIYDHLIIVVCPANLAGVPDALLEAVWDLFRKIFPGILIHLLRSIASYVRINDGIKGQKQAPIDPKWKGERSAQTAP